MGKFPDRFRQKRKEVQRPELGETGHRGKIEPDLVGSSEPWGDKCKDIVLAVRFRWDLQKDEKLKA